MEQATKSTNTKKIQTSGAQRRLRVLFICMLGFIVWAGYTLWQQEVSLAEKNNELQVLENNRIELEQLQGNYYNEITKLNDPEYIEQMARRDYQMSRPGDTSFTTTRFR